MKNRTAPKRTTRKIPTRSQSLPKRRALTRKSLAKLTFSEVPTGWEEVASIDFAGWGDCDCDQRIIFKTPDGSLKALKTTSDSALGSVEDVTREQVMRWLRECVIPKEFEDDFMPPVHSPGDVAGEGCPTPFTFIVEVDQDDFVVLVKEYMANCGKETVPLESVPFLWDRFLEMWEQRCRENHLTAGAARAFFGSFDRIACRPLREALPLLEDLYSLASGNLGLGKEVKATSNALDNFKKLEELRLTIPKLKEDPF